MSGAFPSLIGWTAPALTGVRQRVIVTMLAASLAVLTQTGPPPEPGTGATGSFETTFSLGDEELRLTCEGAGQVTVLFLTETAGGRSVWRNARNDLAAIARVCTVRSAAGDDDAILHPDRADGTATALAAALREADVPSPYVMVGPESARAVVECLLDHAPGLVAGALLIDTPRDPATGHLSHENGGREIALGDSGSIVMALRSLIWPPAAV